MKAAIISDIHGNSPALEAVLDSIGKEIPETIYVLGDVAHGVDLKRCLQLIYDLPNRRCIKGNVEQYICVQDLSGWNRPKDGSYRFGIEWKRRVMESAGRELFDFVCAWPDFLCENDVYFMHDAPWDRRLAQEQGPDLPPELRELAYHGGGVLPQMSEEDAQEIDNFLRENRVSTLFCGHTHLPFVRELPHGRVVNCGSVGQPFGRDPRAVWVAWQDDGSCAIRRVQYDIEKTVALHRGSAEQVRLFRLGLELGDHPNEITEEEKREK